MSTNALPIATRDPRSLPDETSDPTASTLPPPRRFGGLIPEHETPKMLRAAVLRLAWPSIVENLLQSLVQIATTAMVSRLGADALAGVGVGNQLMQVGISTFFAVSTGTTVLVAYNIGAGNPKEAGQAAKQSYFIGIILSVIVALLGFLFSAPLIGLLGAEPSVVAEGAKFLRIEALGTIFLVTMFISSGILRGSGDTRTPMLVTLSINFINVGVSLPLIFGLGPLPHLGVVGAACGNIVARFIGCV
ncbi:MAG: polysaccharide biosynthesis C-terminal domain-containing protein, partial [Thermomicrobia bacterium]|nr:polysaccharide biosynthesis C-terminal domain-containing protein [Thermomicrobia bacterium]